MDEKKVVEIEGRIPTLKEKRKQRANRRLIIYVSGFFILMTAVIYFQSSFSHIKAVNVTGNEHVMDDELVEMTNLLDDVSMWRYDERDIISRLEAHPEISSASLSRQLPNTVVISVKEHSRVAYVKRDGKYLPMLETGVVLTGTDRAERPYDAPVMAGFEENDTLSEMASELTSLPESLHQRISEVHLVPSENDPHQLMIFMNDGFEVHSTLRHFSERIIPYPSIVAQLDEDAQGIIHMRMSPYFESTASDEGIEEELEEVSDVISEEGIEEIIEEEDESESEG
ncbi:cell division protein FtsQ/DivIB [Bacillus sp. H-16]|uniref:cell division protein FtsQ/DivIB n=1 Tax=Alteribacter salitolerans TaxID=2912333 RepID=UPI0019637A33|nr:cell division protein FtsQ/DivIB [Alteribacter salitolerans]MBM7095863.1 cell division protein FtsQ/DivIB [Alteribacter salitolerans]